MSRACYKSKGTDCLYMSRVCYKSKGNGYVYICYEMFCKSKGTCYVYIYHKFIIRVKRFIEYMNIILIFITLQEYVVKTSFKDL